MMSKVNLTQKEAFVLLRALEEFHLRYRGHYTKPYTKLHSKLSRIAYGKDASLIPDIKKIPEL